MSVCPYQIAYDSLWQFMTAYDSCFYMFLHVFTCFYMLLQLCSEIGTRAWTFLVSTSAHPRIIRYQTSAATAKKTAEEGLSWWGKMVEGKTQRKCLSICRFVSKVDADCSIKLQSDIRQMWCYWSWIHKDNSFCSFLDNNKFIPSRYAETWNRLTKLLFFKLSPL